MAMQIYVSIKFSLQHPRDISTDFYAKGFPQIQLSSHDKKDFLLAPMCSVYHHNLNKRHNKKNQQYLKNWRDLLVLELNLFFKKNISYLST